MVLSSNRDPHDTESPGTRVVADQFLAWLTPSAMSPCSIAPFCSVRRRFGRPILCCIRARKFRNDDSLNQITFEDIGFP
jgi:hypothetical protein